MKGAKTASMPRKADTSTNTHPHMKWAKTTSPTPISAIPKKADTPPERKGAKTTSMPNKADTPTNTKADSSKVALRTPTVNCLGKNA